MHRWALALTLCAHSTKAAVSNRSKAAPYSITSSARTSTEGGIVRPSVLAVWNCVGLSFDGNCLNGCWRDDDIGVELNQFRRRFRESLHIAIGRSVYHLEIPAFCVPELSHTVQERSEIFGGKVRSMKI
jgi:hypothetical protein